MNVVVKSKAKAECRLTHEANKLPFPEAIYSVVVTSKFV